MKPLKESTLIICSIVRNAANGLKRNIPVINSLCKYAKSYKIIIFENNSLDQTKAILKEWQYEIGQQNLYLSMYDIENSNVIPSEKEVNVNPFFCKERISRMVELRNQYMDYITTQKLEADYLIIVDLDVSRLFLGGILSSFKLAEDWDAITANGYSLSPSFCRRYHDTYALTEWGKENIPQDEKQIVRNANRYGRLRKNDMLVRVFSAYGGLAIYRFESIKGIRYQLLPNNDSRVEMKCEHFSIYKQMVEKGFNRIYINPAMSLKYQTVNWRIVYKTLIRWFDNMINA